ncbi:adenosylcobinamide-GDP ribazoletransferase [Fulvimarina sp. MAC8]|uniref:adenosylcobinamide-GDP ribazoletransferase n=1 Tax=Fulvimarina sp. MAC8 TaxID=3162874 RepID=UPI0032EAC6CD
MPDPVKRLLRSLAFLTRLPPVASAFDDGPHPLGKDVTAFPVAGLIAAAPSALVLFLIPQFSLSPLLIAVIAVAAAVLMTGALHEDGLGDVADGLFGHLPRERAVEVMKDSRVGTYGALALIISAAARIAIFAELIAFSPLTAALGALGAAALSRGFMALLWASLPTADAGGLAESVGRPDRHDAWIALAIGGAIFVCLTGFGFSIGIALLALAFGTLTFAGFRWWLKRRLGGQTGDTLGAVQQLTEIAALFGLCFA